MHTTWDVLGAFIIGLIVSFGFTPFVRIIAVRTGYLDHPEKKKAHIHPTPLLGGVAIYLAFMASVLFAEPINHTMLGVLLGATMLLVLGLVDDKMGMMPQLKLCVQILAALTVFKFGLRVTTIDDYYLCMVFTVFWIVGITNAFNLLDNLNGLSSGIAAISALFFCIISFANGDLMVSSLSAGIVGASIGFIKYNFPKAFIFMGDSGSLVLGFLLACIAVMGSWITESVSLSLSIPIIILAYPIFDTTLVTVIRLVEGRSIFQGGKDHSSHTLAFMGLRKKRAVLIIFLICILLGTSALAVKYSSLAAGRAIVTITSVSMLLFGLRLLSVRKKMVAMRNGN